MKQFFLRGILAKIALIFLGISATLILGEIILSILFPPATGYYVWKPNLHYTVRPSPDALPGIKGPSRIITNSKGMLGDELLPDHTYKILTVGGSTTACLLLDHSERWPYLLQEKLNQAQRKHNVWVGNIGRSGHKSWHHIIQVKYLLNQYPEIDALIILMGINDFQMKIHQGRDYHVSLFAKPESEELLREAFYRLPEHRHETIPFYKRTTLWRLTRPATARIIQRLTRKNAHRGNIQDVAGTEYDEERGKRPRARILLDHLPELTPALEEYSMNVNTLINLVRNKSVRIIFLTQPVMWKSGLSKELSNLCRGRKTRNEDEYYSIGALATGMEMYNEKLLKICQIRQVECLNLALFLSKDTSTFYDDAHFNESGAEKTAEVLAQYMLRRYPYKESEKDVQLYHR